MTISGFSSHVTVSMPSMPWITTVMRSATASGTLAARWTFEDGQVVDEESRSVSGVQVSEFHLSHPDGWPAGHYEVIISLDGEEVERSGFDVSTGG